MPLHSKGVAWELRVGFPAPGARTQSPRQPSCKGSCSWRPCRDVIRLPYRCRRRELLSGSSRLVLLARAFLPTSLSSRPMCKSCICPDFVFSLRGRQLRRGDVIRFAPAHRTGPLCAEGGLDWGLKLTYKWPSTYEFFYIISGILLPDTTS